MLKSFVLSLCSLLLLASCKDNTTKKENRVASETNMNDFDYGKTENNVYRNDFFRMEIPLPPTWVIQTKEEVSALNDKGADILAKDDEELKAVLKASEVKTAYLITIFRDSVGSTRNFNPSFIALSENTSQFPQVKKGSDYLDNVKILLKNSNIGYTFDETYGSKKIGPYDFDILESKAVMNGTEVSQHYYATITKGFALCFITTFADDTQKREVEKIINDIVLQ